MCWAHESRWGCEAEAVQILQDRRIHTMTGSALTPKKLVIQYPVTHSRVAAGDRASDEYQRLQPHPVRHIAHRALQQGPHKGIRDGVDAIDSL